MFMALLARPHVLAAVAACLYLSIASGQAQTYSEGEWTFTVDYSNPSAGKAVVNSYNGGAGSVLIPPKLGGAVVVALDGIVFGGTKITSVIIPSSVTRIGSGAFWNCTGLTSVTIPDGVTSIGSSAFYNCTGLTSVIIPDRVTSIGNNAFDGCTGLTSVTIGKGVTNIGSDAFFACHALQNVYFRGDMPSIGGAIFGGIIGGGTVFYPAGNKTWGTTYAGWPTQAYDLISPSVDRTRPTLVVSVPRRASAATKSSRFTLQGTARDNVSPTKIQFKIRPPKGSYPQGWTTVNLPRGSAQIKNWSRPINLTRKGTWNVQIRALDARNNLSAVKTISIVRR